MSEQTRQLVADAAEWLWQNRKAASEHWLDVTSATNLLNICAYAKKFDRLHLLAPGKHSMVSVMEAYLAVSTTGFLPGTSNWCAALAAELNK